MAESQQHEPEISGLCFLKVFQLIAFPDSLNYHDDLNHLIEVRNITIIR